MTQRDLADSLEDILEAIGAIERFTANVNLENFGQNFELMFYLAQRRKDAKKNAKKLHDK